MTDNAKLAITEIFKTYSPFASDYDFNREKLDAINACIEWYLELNNNYDEMWYPMDYLEDYLDGWTITDILFNAFYGNDEATQQSFNPCRDYFQIDSLGHLNSSYCKDYRSIASDIYASIDEDYSIFVQAKRYTELEDALEHLMDVFEIDIDNTEDIEV